MNKATNCKQPKPIFLTNFKKKFQKILSIILKAIKDNFLLYSNCSYGTVLQVLCLLKQKTKTLRMKTPQNGVSIDGQQIRPSGCRKKLFLPS